MIYRGTDFIANVLFGSSPLSRLEAPGDTQEDGERGQLADGEGGREGGGLGSRIIYDGKKPWPSINH
jgi:hypothetical protein